ncbi:FMN-binding protein [Defluviitalea phaphyphila]|uniref:FMN-binding protein n=1 Tax=Defluviitalea phaphyphila TaxID=1473580 RepID=UPI000730DBB0|nr:FMN-binding protein [Defluviitalea phaphyphila]
MKKIIALGLALGLSFATLTGCNSEKKADEENTNAQVEQQADDNNTEAQTEQESNDNNTETTEVTYTDGTYTAEGEPDERGWKPVITIEVKDGKIASVDYDEVNEEEGTTKQDNEEYNNLMKEKNGIGPADFFPQLESALVEKQDPEAVDVISGATHGSESFKEVAKKALESAK